MSNINDILKMAEAIEVDEVKETPDGRKVGFKNGEIVYSLYDRDKDGKFDAIDINSQDGIKTYVDTDGNGIADKMEVYEYSEGRITQIKIDSDENGVFEEVHNSNINDDFNNYVESIEYYNNDTNEIYAKDNLMKEASFVISREEDTNNDGKFDKKIEYTYITSKAVDDCKNHQGQNENLSSEDIIRSNVGIAFIDKDGDGEYESLNF